jgi:hypothetical protein
MEAGNKMPKKDVVLQTMDSDYYLFKQDILAQMMTYSTDKKKPVNLETISVQRAHEIIAMNKEGKKPLSLADDGKAKEAERPKDMLDGSDLTRFDRSKKKKKKKKHNPQ